jgi:hypothetical protein
VDQVRGSSGGSTEHAIDRTSRYIRITVIAGEQSGGNVARIYEFEAYA